MSLKLNMCTEPNGDLILSNEETRITITQDGTIVVSSYAPVQLTGACVHKLEVARALNQDTRNALAALSQRIPDKMRLPKES